MTPEQQARQQIDAQLTASGWIVQDYKALNLSAGPGIAVREVPLTTGPCDYLLLVDRKPVGVVEAKRKEQGKNLSVAADQSTRYASSLPDFLAAVVPGKLPFLYESTGVETFFRDERDPDPRSRRVFSFHRPETLAEWAAEPDTLRRRVAKMPVATATRHSGDARLPDRSHHQSRKILRRRPAARAHPDGHRRGQDLHRLRFHLPAHQVCRRAPRPVPGGPRQSRPPGHRRVPAVRHARHRPQVHRALQRPAPHLEPARLRLPASPSAPSSAFTRCCAARNSTKTSTKNPASKLAARGRPSRSDVAYNPAIPIETFDFIVTDECHRSIYNLWRQVLEYFDAFLIGLTATPSKQTIGFFNQNLVMEYNHERAVADGVNVGYDVYRIKTQVTEQGGKVEKGFYVDKRSKETRARRWEQLDEDLTYAAQDLDRSVVVPSQIRTVLTGVQGRALHRTVSRTRARAQDTHLLQGRLPRRGHRPPRARSVRQGQRLRQEDHLQAKHPDTGKPANIRDRSSRNSAPRPNSASPSPWT